MVDVRRMTAAVVDLRGASVGTGQSVNLWSYMRPKLVIVSLETRMGLVETQWCEIHGMIRGSSARVRLVVTLIATEISFIYSRREYLQL